MKKTKRNIKSLDAISDRIKKKANKPSSSGSCRWFDAYVLAENFGKIRKRFLKKGGGVISTSGRLNANAFSWKRRPVGYPWPGIYIRFSTDEPKAVYIYTVLGRFQSNFLARVSYRWGVFALFLSLSVGFLFYFVARSFFRRLWEELGLNSREKR